MKRGALAVLSPKVTKHGARAAASGHRQTKTRGDATQIGGVVVFAADGEPIWEHIENEAGDLCDLDELLTALEAHTTP
jgi:hypothetical protein